MYATLVLDFEVRMDKNINWFEFLYVMCGIHARYTMSSRPSLPVVMIIATWNHHSLNLIIPWPFVHFNSHHHSQRTLH
jgi:hypothetical protein